MQRGSAPHARRTRTCPQEPHQRYSLRGESAPPSSRLQIASAVGDSFQRTQPAFTAIRKKVPRARTRIKHESDRISRFRVKAFQTNSKAAGRRVVAPVEKPDSPFKKTVEDGSQAVCSQHTRTPPRRHALSTRGGAAASRGRGLRGGLEREQNPGGEREAGTESGGAGRGADSGTRAGAGCGPWTGASPGGEREAEAESGGAGNKTYLL